LFSSLRHLYHAALRSCSGCHIQLCHCAFPYSSGSLLLNDARCNTTTSTFCGNTTT
jgi:hypothetical protein